MKTNNEKLNRGIKEIKNLKMTADEKKQIFDYVLSSSLASEQPVRSQWVGYSFVLKMRKSKFAYALVVFLLVITTGGGAVFASQESLPDDIFYPIKVSIVEPIRGALISSPIVKAEYESNLATKRLVEAETLADQGKLDKAKEEKLSGLLVNHTEALNKALDKASESQSSEKLDDIAVNFHAGMKAHARVLDVITGQNQKDEESNTARAIENKDKDAKISQNARDNAGKVKETLDKKEEDSLDKYAKRKNAVKSLIDSTITDINNASVDGSAEKQAIVEDTNKTLEEAKRFLEEADKKEQEGDSRSAYSTLLDSESSVREAKIFLKEGIKLKEKNNERINRED